MSQQPLPLFTPRAQLALAMSRKEADRLGHNVVDSAHLLLGIIRLAGGRAFRALENMGVPFDAMRLELDKQLADLPTTEEWAGNIPYTPRLKRIFAVAMREAHERKHREAGTGHFLLALLREPEGVAARVLGKFGVNLDRAEEELAIALVPRG